MQKKEILAGCPYDFDGIRVDDGGQGGIEAQVTDSSASYNLADGTFEADLQGTTATDSGGC